MSRRSGGRQCDAQNSGPAMTRRQVLKLGAAGGARGRGVASGIVPRAAAQAPELVVAFSIDPGHMDPRVEAARPAGRSSTISTIPFCGVTSASTPFPGWCSSGSR